MKTKIKCHGDEVTDFYDKKIPKVDSNHTCLTVISLGFALKNDENYYQQVFLKGHPLLSGSGPGPRPSEKANPGPLEKVDFIPKFTV